MMFVQQDAAPSWRDHDLRLEQCEMPGLRVGQLEVGLLLFLEHLREKRCHLLLAEGPRECDVCTIGGDLVVLNAVYLGLRLVNVRFDAVAQGLSARFAKRLLHAPQSLLLRTVAILQFFNQ